MADKSSFLSARTSFLSAIRGPIMMITIGVLFAIDYSAGVPFHKTWPVILIVAGLLRLLGRPSAGSLGTGLQATNLQGTGLQGTGVQGTNPQ